MDTQTIKRGEHDRRGPLYVRLPSVFGRSLNDGRFTRLQANKPVVAERNSADGSGFGVSLRGDPGALGVSGYGPAGWCRRWARGAGGGGRGGGRGRERRRQQGKSRFRGPGWR